MPYIQKDRRAHLSCYRANLPDTPGELNYVISMLLIRYIEQKGLTYTHLNDCIGALEGAKLEFYRRTVVPFEESKRAENGDIY